MLNEAYALVSLLDVLANRKTVGVISGDVLIAGRPTGIDFQRGTAYVEQQDVHEWTSTVREALRFSAYLRQAPEISIQEKDGERLLIVPCCERVSLSTLQTTSRRSFSCWRWRTLPTR